MKGETTSPQLRLIYRDGAPLSDLEAARARHPASLGPTPRLRVMTGGQTDEEGWISLMEPSGPFRAVAQARARPKAVIEYDGFGSLDPGEPDDPEYLGTLARGVAHHGEAFRIWAQLAATNNELQGFDAAYLGCTGKPGLWHEHLADALGVTAQLGAIRPDLQPFIQLDLPAWAKHLRHAGTVVTVGGQEGCHVYLAPDVVKTTATAPAQ